MTFLEKLESGYFRMDHIEPLNVGEEGGYPRYKRGEILTSEKYNEVSEKVDEIAKKSNTNIATILAAITSLNDDVQELANKTAPTDNVTIRINPDTGKLEVIGIPDSLRISSEKVKYHDPDTGQDMNISIGQKIKQIEEKYAESVSFIDKGEIEKYENI